MTRLSQRFEQLKARGEKALVCFVTAGDPTYERTPESIMIVNFSGRGNADMNKAIREIELA